MRIFRFDKEVSRPFSEFGSRFRMGPLTGRDAQVWVQIMHLPPGGLVGRHPAAAHQLFAVVAGSGWATGAQGGRRDLKAGYAALWEPGEEHEAGSESGLTAVSIEGDFEVWATSVTSEIVVSAYNPAWPEWFEQVRSHVWPKVREVALRVDHIGSTAVPGLAAKPIIDMDVVVASEKEVRPAIERLEAAGYRWRGDLGVPGREAFKQVRDQSLPPHHLYLVVENSRAHQDHWLLRDLLRADPEAQDRYAALKRRNVELAASDMDVYVAAKAALVAELLRRARAERGLPPVTYWIPE